MSRSISKHASVSIVVCVLGFCSAAIAAPTTHEVTIYVDANGKIDKSRINEPSLVYGNNDKIAWISSPKTKMLVLAAGGRKGKDPSKGSNLTAVSLANAAGP